MNPVSKSLASSNLIQIIERNKGLLNFFYHYRYLNLQSDPLPPTLVSTSSSDIFTKRRRTMRKIGS